MIWGGRERRRRLNIWCGGICCFRTQLEVKTPWELDVICLKRGSVGGCRGEKPVICRKEHPEELLDYRKRRNIRIATDAYIKSERDSG